MGRLFAQRRQLTPSWMEFQSSLCRGQRLSPRYCSLSPGLVPLQWQPLFTLVFAQVIKYPNVADYTRGLAESDEKQFNAIKFWTNDLRNSYVLLYDVLQKNIEKILKPRSQNATNMY